MNPLFTDDDKNEQQDKNSYLLPRGKAKRIEPDTHTSNDASPAVEMIRTKIDALYDTEPDVKEELAQPVETTKPLSKHQEFMYALSTSGKSLAEIQTEWHKYYSSLADEEKHEVWQEFYQANSRASSHYARFIKKEHGGKPADHPPMPMPPHTEHAAAKAAVFADEHADEPTPAKKAGRASHRRSAAEVKKQVLGRIRSRNEIQLKAKKHLQSLVFGLSLGSLAIIIFMFGFFNERFIIPFIQPSGRVGATPIILSTDGVAPSPDPELIIPKINVELPVVYDLASADESVVQKGLEEGVIHYPSTAVPGQKGNAAFFGHSSNNIFNKGKYKFAFVLLHELAPGDVFYLAYNNKIFTYKVYDKKVVEPTETWVLGPVADKAATVTLITCDPPGTSLHRLVVWAEQITPDPNGNSAAPTTAQTDAAATAAPLPDNGPSLWSRFWHWITPW